MNAIIAANHVALKPLFAQEIILCVILCKMRQARYVVEGNYSCRELIYYRSYVVRNLASRTVCTRNQYWPRCACAPGILWITCSHSWHNVEVHQIRPAQRAFTTSTTFPLPVNQLPTSAVGFGWHIFHEKAVKSDFEVYFKLLMVWLILR